MENFFNQFVFSFDLTEKKSDKYKQIETFLSEDGHIKLTSTTWYLYTVDKQTKESVLDSLVSTGLFSEDDRLSVIPSGETYLIYEPERIKNILRKFKEIDTITKINGIYKKY